MATLTGAARVALGPDLPPFYTDDEALAADLARHAAAENDPLWRCRCGGPTKRCSTPRSPTSTTSRRRLRRLDHGGAVPAPLRRRTRRRGCISTSMPGRRAAKPARPEGGECQAARALYALLTSALSAELIAMRLAAIAGQLANNTAPKRILARARHGRRDAPGAGAASCCMISPHALVTGGEPDLSARQLARAAHDLSRAAAAHRARACRQAQRRPSR